MRDKLGVLETHFFLNSSIVWTKPVWGEAARLFPGSSECCFLSSGPWRPTDTFPVMQTRYSFTPLSLT